MPIRRRCFRPMCIPFHEVNLSVTIEFLSRERDSNPQMFPSTRFCRPAPYHSDISTYFYLTKCQRTILWERRDSNPQSQKRAMLQTARLPVTGYSPILKKLIYEVQTVRTLSRQPAIRHLRCFTRLLCSTI